MADLPPPLQINAPAAIFVAGRGPQEPYLLPGVRVEKVKEHRSHRSLLFRKRHSWNSPIYVGPGWTYRWCTGGDRCELQVGAGKWEGLALYRVTGGKTYNVRPTLPPDQLPPERE